MEKSVFDKLREDNLDINFTQLLRSLMLSDTIWKNTIKPKEHVYPLLWLSQGSNIKEEARMDKEYNDKDKAPKTNIEDFGKWITNKTLQGALNILHPNFFENNYLDFEGCDYYFKNAQLLVAEEQLNKLEQEYFAKIEKLTADELTRLFQYYGIFTSSDFEATNFSYVNCWLTTLVSLLELRRKAFVLALQHKLSVNKANMHYGQNGHKTCWPQEEKSNDKGIAKMNKNNLLK